tara:strand:+ start:588 stop:815 length:228 start_codon:yes stop_codon:yes gene_type:complete
MIKKKTTKIRELEEIGEIEIDMETIELEELLIAIGGVLFSGTELEEVETPVLLRIEDLIKKEIFLRVAQERDTIH